MSSKLEAWCAEAARKVDDLVRGLDDPDELASPTSLLMHTLMRDLADVARRLDEQLPPDVRAQAQAQGPATRADMAGHFATIEAEECPWVTDRRRWGVVFRAAAFGENVRATHLRLFPGDEQGAAVAVVSLMILRQVREVHFLISDREPEASDSAP